MEEVQLGEPATVLTVDGDGPLSIHEATRALGEARKKAYEQPAEPPKAEPPAAESEPPQAETDAAPPEEAPGEPQAEPEAELPPIEPPRSWAQEAKDQFASLPRETQEYLAQRERERDAAISRSQNEAAEQRKAFEEARQRFEQGRAQYEQALPIVAAQVQAQFFGEFADVKSFADLERMASEDPFRYQRFQLAQQKAQAAQQELVGIQQRRAQEIQNAWNEYSKKEDARFTEAVPEMSDPAKAQALQRSASASLEAIGFTKQEINAAWNGQTGISMRDARVQRIILDAARWREAQAKVKQVSKAPIPPVQRPGTSRPAGAGNMAEIQSIQKELQTATGRRAIDLARQLTQLKRESGQLERY